MKKYDDLVLQAAEIAATCQSEVELRRKLEEAAIKCHTILWQEDKSVCETHRHFGTEINDYGYFNTGSGAVATLILAAAAA